MAAEPLLDVVADRTLVPRRSSSFFFRLLALQSLAFFFTFAAFNAAQSLAGSIPAPPGLAPIQFMAIYVTFALLCIPAPKLLSHIGPKACMILGMSPYAALVASFLAPHVCTADTAGGACWSAGAIWALRLTTAVLLGMGAPILWTGQGVYLGRLAAHEARRVSKGLGEEEVARETSLTLKRYNGVFWSVFQLSGAAGLVSSSLVLSLVQSTSAITYLFLGLSACCAAGLVLVVTSLPALPPAAPAEQPEPTGEPGAAMPAAERDGGGDGGGSGGGGGGDVTVLATLRLCADPRMLYLVPNILYNGLSLAYTWYMYNTFVFGTSLGTSFVGFGGAPAHLPTCPPAHLPPAPLHCTGPWPSVRAGLPGQCAGHLRAQPCRVALRAGAHDGARHGRAGRAVGHPAVLQRQAHRLRRLRGRHRRLLPQRYGLRRRRAALPAVHHRRRTAVWRGAASVRVAPRRRGAACGGRRGARAARHLRLPPGRRRVGEPAARRAADALRPALGAAARGDGKSQALAVARHQRHVRPRPTQQPPPVRRPPAGHPPAQLGLAPLGAHPRRQPRLGRSPRPRRRARGVRPVVGRSTGGDGARPGRQATRGLDLPAAAHRPAELRVMKRNMTCLYQRAAASRFIK
eukprot:scaffold8196_cov69-Phaeocystis_antarctica.AAC.5